MKRALALVLAAALALCAGVAQAGGPPNYVGGTPAAPTFTGTVTASGGLVVGESLGPELLTQTCTGWGLASPVGASSCAANVITRTASGSNLTLSNTAAVAGDEYELVLDVATRTAGSVTISAGGQSCVAVATARTQTCRVPAGTTGAVTITFDATFAGTINVLTTSAKKITSTVSAGTGPVVFDANLASATENESGVRIIGHVTGAVGTKNALAVATTTTTSAPSANAIVVDPVLSAMDGSDTWNGVLIAPTNADHTGSSNAVNAINIGAITGDAQATESALLFGSGWDYEIRASSALDITTDGDGINLTAASVNAPAIKFALSSDSTITTQPIVLFGQNATNVELTGTAVQDFVGLKPEFLQTGAGGYNVLHLIAAEPTTAGSGGSGAQNLITASTAANDFTSEVQKFVVTREGNVDTPAAYRVSMVANATTQVGQVVAMANSATPRFTPNAAVSGSVNTYATGAMPIGVYSCEQYGCGAAAAASTYKIAQAGVTRVAMGEDLADCTYDAVLHSSNGSAGYGECDTTAGTDHNAEIGHPMAPFEAKYTYNANTGVNTTTNVITFAAAPTTWAVGTPVVCWASGDTVPTSTPAFTSGNVFWVLSISTADVTLSATKGGAVVDFTAAGSGTTCYCQALQTVLLHFN